MTTTSEALSKAADIIEKHGLAKGNYYDAANGCYCTVGAIARAGVSPDVPDFKLYEFIDDELIQDGILAVQRTVRTLPKVKASEASVTTWNDRKRRTQAEVVATLRKAAEAVQ